MIAALYVRRGGPYWDLPDVDPWDEERDARLYPGPWPVVAHPPCSRWCRLAGLVEARWGHRRGEDGGCFAAALGAVRRWGGVLEHPAYTDAWAAFGLPRPDPRGGWQHDLFGGAACHVEQGSYGHPARKATWLYACRSELPDLAWGEATSPTATCSWGHHQPRQWDFSANGSTGWRERRRLSSAEASATPAAFRDILLGMARSAPTPSAPAP